MECPEHHLIRIYKEELASTRAQINVLTQRANALIAAIQGLTSVIEAGAGSQPHSSSRRDERTISGSVLTAVNQIPEGRREVKSIAEPTDAVMRQAAAVLAEAQQPLGAKDLHRGLIARGILTNYNTLYRNLDREAAKPNGILHRFDEKFGLKQWLTNGIVTAR